MDDERCGAALANEAARRLANGCDPWDDDPHEPVGAARLREILLAREAATARFRELERRLPGRR